MTCNEGNACTPDGCQEGGCGGSRPAQYLYLNFIPAYLLIEGGKAYDNDPRQRMTATSSQPALRGVVERPLLLGVLGLSLLVLVMPRAAANEHSTIRWRISYAEVMPHPLSE